MVDLGSVPGARLARSWWRKDDTPAPPPITTTTAWLLLVLYALSYFVPFYFTSTTRPSPTLSRDDISVIRSRIRLVTTSCFLCLASTALILTKTASASFPTVLHLTGLWPPALYDSLCCLLLTALLFLGPLFHYFIVDSGWEEWTTLTPLREIFTEWTTYRTIIVGPLTEELLFRSCSIPLLLASSTSFSQMIFLSPLIFGLAHVHHFYEFRLTHPQAPMLAALLRSVFQLSYTWLFGAYATFIFLRSGSLLAVFVVHAFCNSIGLPKVWGRLRRVEDEMRGRETGMGWSVVYYVLLVGGAVIWWKALWGLSVSENGLVSREA